MIDNAIEKGNWCENEVRTFLVASEDNLEAAGYPPEVLTLGGESDESVLPVFSFEEEALLFLRLCGFGSGWRVSKSSATHLASVLSDACPDARRVALDPIPRSASAAPRSR